jgi:hypothetical protein
MIRQFKLEGESQPGGKMANKPQAGQAVLHAVRT